MSGRVPVLPWSEPPGGRPNAYYDKNIARHAHYPNFPCARYSVGTDPGQGTLSQNLILAKQDADHICDIAAERDQPEADR
jgi:hypothetical protein